jgi:hypothetical protein
MLDVRDTTGLSDQPPHRTNHDLRGGTANAGLVLADWLR